MTGIANTILFNQSTAVAEVSFYAGNAVKAIYILLLLSTSTWCGGAERIYYKDFKVLNPIRCRAKPTNLIANGKNIPIGT